MNELIELDLLQLALALGLVVATIALSTWQKLGLEWNLIVATGRTLLQLIVMGYFLELVFTWPNPLIVLIAVVLLVGVTAFVIRNRISQKLTRLLPWVGGSLLVSTVLTLGYVNLVVIRPEIWYDPRYVIPLAGILLGNAMNAAAIAGERFVNTLNGSQLDIETYLSLGATPQQAIAPYRRDALRAGLLPTINTMLVVGLATLPTFLSGQLLGGVRPINAVAYQIVILLALALFTLIANLMIVHGIYRQFFNAAAQFTKP